MSSFVDVKELKRAGLRLHQDDELIDEGVYCLQSTPIFEVFKKADSGIKSRIPLLAGFRKIKTPKLKAFSDKGTKLRDISFDGGVSKMLFRDLKEAGNKVIRC